MSIMEFVGAGFTLVAAVVSFLYANSSRKSKNSAQKIERNIEKMKNEMVGNITSKNKIAAIAEIRSKTEVFQKVISKYQRANDLVGYDLNEDLAELDKYMSEIKEENWIFENSGINFSDRLYEDLSEIYNGEGPEIDAIQMRSISFSLKPKLENFKSALSKISNQHIIN